VVPCFSSGRMTVLRPSLRYKLHIWPVLTWQNKASHGSRQSGPGGPLSSRQSCSPQWDSGRAHADMSDGVSPGHSRPAWWCSRDQHLGTGRGWPQPRAPWRGSVCKNCWQHHHTYGSFRWL
jgi:hypothetical protein